MTDEFGRHRMQVEEYERYAAGLLGDTELIDGTIFDVSPEPALHAQAAADLARLLPRFWRDHKVLTTGQVTFDRYTRWAPDVYVLGRRERLELVVEVSLPDTKFGSTGRPRRRPVVSTWLKDHEFKKAACARNGVPEFWIVDPNHDGRLLQFFDPADGEYCTYIPSHLPDGVAALDRGWLFELLKR